MDRNSIRSKLLATKERKSKRITLFGVEVEFKQPTLREVLSIPSDGSDTRDAITTILINQCYVPGTDERVFEEADRDAILNWPAGDWLNEVTNVISELTSVDVDTASKN